MKKFAWRESILAGIISGIVVAVVTSGVATKFYENAINNIINPRVILDKSGTKYILMPDGSMSIEEKDGTQTYVPPEKPWM